MFGHKSGADLSTQSALIQPIEDVRHAMTGDARAGAIVEYVVEACRLPGHTKYDDQVDSTSQALDHMREDDVFATYLKAFGR
jgi:phage terminase large subunit-like protein